MIRSILSLLLCVYNVKGIVQFLSSSSKNNNKNILMITSDDLRPQLNYAYNMTETITPRIDMFAKQSLVFHRAYTQIAVCSPSRNSFMTSRRPDTTKVWNFLNHFREPEVGADWIALPQWFKQNGYLTYASGKLYHPQLPPNNDYPTSWTNDSFNSYYWGNSPPIGDAMHCTDDHRADLTPIMLAYNSTIVCVNRNMSEAMNDHDDRDTPQVKQGVEYDHRLGTRTIEFLQRAAVARKESGTPFFIGVGFRKPHVDWRTPVSFWEMYNSTGNSLSIAAHSSIGENISVLAYEMNGPTGKPYFHASTKTTYRESPNGGIPEDLQRGLRRGYYSAVSFLDHEVGRILDELDSLGLTESTAVLLHADHGWKLGEHGDWSKCSNWELDTRVPFILRVPWIKSSIGQRTMAFAELVDIYPTLVELSGLPPVPSTQRIEGVSLVPVLNNPIGWSEEDPPHNKTAAFSQYPRCPQFNITEDPIGWECLVIPKQNFTRMGFSVRTAEARYTEWRVWSSSCTADWTSNGLVTAELYDHVGDLGRGADTFDNYEYINLAYVPERQGQVMAMASMLKEMFDKPTNGC
eukprot:m.157145 g.157145  ORF g.157145 m.157145 type:complete len:576 (+) comp15110_c0_seq1:1469-3196(+)